MSRANYIITVFTYKIVAGFSGEFWVGVYAGHKERGQGIELFLFIGEAFDVYVDVAAEDKLEFFADYYGVAADVAAFAFVKVEAFAAKEVATDWSQDFITLSFSYNNALF